MVGDLQNNPGRSLFVRLVGPTAGPGAAGKYTDAATGDHGDLLDIIRERNVLSIMGNHDVCAAGLREPIDFNPIARDAILWTRRVLTAENNHFLTVLPDARRVQDRFLMVHGAVTHRDNYIFNEFDARESFEPAAFMRELRVRPDMVVYRAV